MKNIVLITGDLAAGKSTLADNLSNVLKYPSIKKDPIKEIICDSVGFNNRDENRKISVAAVNSMIHVLEQILKVGGDAILDANFRISEINAIQDLAKKYEASLKIFYLFGDNKVLYERFMARVPTRHKAHLSLGLDKDFDKYVEYINELRNQIKNIDAISLDVTNLNEKDLLSKAISYLEK